MIVTLKEQPNDLPTRAPRVNVIASQTIFAMSVS